MWSTINYANEVYCNSFNRVLPISYPNPMAGILAPVLSLKDFF